MTVLLEVVSLSIVAQIFDPAVPMAYGNARVSSGQDLEVIHPSPPSCRKVAPQVIELTES